MAPNFLSRFAKGPPPASSAAETQTTRERSHSNTQRSSFSLSRSRAPSVTSPSRTDVRSPPESSSLGVGAKGGSQQQQQPQIAVVPSIMTTDINRSNDTLEPNVTVVPPSPLVYTASIASESDYDDRYHPTEPTAAAPNQITTTTNGASAQSKSKSGTGDYSAPSPRTRTTSTSAPLVAAASLTSASPSPISVEDVDVTPTTAKPSIQRAVTPSSSSTNLREAAAKPESMPSSKSLSPSSGQIRKQSSNRSLNAPAPITTRAATAPPDAFSAVVVDANGAVTMTPIVESPTGLKAPEFPSMITNGTNNNTSTLTVNRDNSDSASIISSKGGEKKRPWKRSTTKKPTGLASAIAATGLAMANPSMTYVQMSPPPPIMSPLPTSRKSSNPGSPPYMSRSPASSSKHVKSRSADMSLSPGGKRGAGGGKGKSKTVNSGAIRTSVSANSDAASEYVGGEDRPEYYSGLESSSDDGSGSDDLDDLDLGEDDIPVTGFAVASNKRNADFHDLFSGIPEGDYLIEDYGCALQREILIQGRIYISENHICFHANIFGWITNLSIPIYEIVSLEKKMTAFVIPNAIQITTRQSKYTFASFLSRDTTFDVIYNIWRLARPDDNGSIRSSGRGSLDGPVSSGSTSGLPLNAVAVVAAKSGAGPAAVVEHKVTTCACSKDGNHYSETMMESIFPGTPDRIHNLMFASGFIKDFLAVDQKLLDLQMSDWTPVSEGSKLLTKNMSYIKPLNGSLGPKQTKCEIKDEMLHVDFEQYVTTLTTTRTPDVPSGGVFSVKTRTCITWASAVSTKVLVTTAVEWTGRSFIKGIIERSAIDGQRIYHADLEKAMRAYIQEHQSEFIPEGVDPDIALVNVAVPAITEDIHAAAAAALEPLSEKQREHERNQRGLQWAWDTFDGAYQVAKRSTKGALELVSDAWEQSTSTTILYFVIVVLVFSNLYTLLRMGSREEAGRRKEMRKVEEREKWVQSIVTALWDELAAGKKEAIGMLRGGAGDAGGVVDGTPSADTVAPGSWMEEVAHLHDTLNTVEQRVKAIREALVGFKGLNAID